MEIELTKGSRFNLSKEAPDLKKVAIGLGWQVSKNGQSYDVDASVFMLSASGKVPNDNYFVFYNNLQSFDGALKHTGDNRTGEGNGDDETIYVDLAKVNPVIQEIVFVVTIHEAQETEQNFSQIKNPYIKIYNYENKRSIARYNLKEAFSQETAVEFGRLYKKEDEWRFQAVGEGYNTGLKTFVDKFINNSRHEEDASAREKKLENIQDNKPQIAISLDKKIEEKAPHIFNLVKKADISLQKVNLTNHKAKVALCLDISGSMSWLYSSGKIQIFAEKILALGCRFDDNASIDIFLFGADAHHVGEMNIDNFKDFIQNVLQKYPLEGGTYYGKAMKMIKEYYFKGWQKMINKHFASNQPVYVMFVTDGATHDQLETEKILKESSHQPIFWQFMAIGKSRKDVKGEGILGWLSQLIASDFSFLEQLDEMNDRFLDNADFFSVEDPETIADQQLYDLLMAEYPNWVKLAKAKKILR